MKGSTPEPGLAVSASARTFVDWLVVTVVVAPAGEVLVLVASTELLSEDVGVVGAVLDGAGDVVLVEGDPLGLVVQVGVPVIVVVGEPVVEVESVGDPVVEVESVGDPVVEVESVGDPVVEVVSVGDPVAVAVPVAVTVAVGEDQVGVGDVDEQIGGVGVQLVEPKFAWVMSVLWGAKYACVSVAGASVP